MPRALLATLLVALPAAAQPPIPPADARLAGAIAPAKIDAPKTVAPYKVVWLSTKLEPDEQAYWQVEPAAAVDWVAGAEGGKVGYVAPPAKYGVEVLIVGVKDGKPTLRRGREDVTIGEPPAPPVPPVPPVPNPYRAGLKAAYDADGGDLAAKEAVRARLVELYRLGADMSADPAVTTTDVLRERLRRAAATLAADGLVGTRTAIAQLLAPVLPLGQPLTAESRAAAALLFRQVAEALAW